MKQNKVALFNNELDQWDSVKQQWACTIFATAICMKYNIEWINLKEEDLDAIIAQQVGVWKLSYTEWAYAIDSINAVVEYANKKYNKKIKIEKVKSNDLKRINEIIDMWYAINILIKVNTNFILDVKDWKIDWTNYFNYTTWKTFWHSLSLIKWKWRFVSWYNWEDLNKLMILDNYAFNKKWKAWNYTNLNLSQLHIISQNNFYFIHE